MSANTATVAGWEQAGLDALRLLENYEHQRMI